MKILIISNPALDVHADAVRWGFVQWGATVTIWDWEAFPTSSSAMVHFDGNAACKVEISVEGQKVHAPFDVIWVRRCINPRAPNAAHPDDKKVIERESLAFLQTILPYLGHADTVWINHPEAEYLGKNKLHQLITAVSTGFRVPDTRIGNSAATVRSFFADNPHGIVFKGLGRASWENSNKSRTVQKTSRLTKESISSDYSIDACPAIYQTLVPKQGELRVTVIGDIVVAAALSNEQNPGVVDWRYDLPGQGARFQSCLVSPELQAKCLALIQKLNLTFGALDIILTPEGEEVFLEVNTAGQFLFLEIDDPSLFMLETFCHVIAKRVSFETNDRPALRLSDYFESDSYARLLELEAKYKAELVARTL